MRLIEFMQIDEHVSKIIKDNKDFAIFDNSILNIRWFIDESAYSNNTIISEQYLRISSVKLYTQTHSANDADKQKMISLLTFESL